MAADARHKFVTQRAAELLGAEPAKVLDALKDAQNMAALNSLFESNGSRKLFVLRFAASAAPSASSSDGEHVSDTSSDDEDELQSLIPSSSDDSSPFKPTGEFAFLSEPRVSLSAAQCAYFLRFSGKAITASNVDTEVLSGRVDADLLTSLGTRLREIMLPSLRRQENWGELSKAAAEEAEREIQGFLDGMEKFVSVLSEASNSLTGNVVLAKPTKKFDIENAPAAFLKAATKPEVISAYEDCLDEWCKQIAMLLAESTQVRKETDESGPNTELEYWKNRMARFNSVTDQLRRKTCRIVLGVLTAAKSRKLKNWKDLDIRITDAANEAKDNVKYLYSLERFTEPLYKNDPTLVSATIPGLINAIKMMHSIARYYNTSERMTALFVKITNQMILCCRRYIEKDGRFWDQDRSVMIAKLRACLEAFEKYQYHYRATKNELAMNPVGKQFDFSEVAIFTKFELFAQRLRKLLELMTIMGEFSSLSTCTIEGMETIIFKFTAACNDIRRKSYDFLDYKKADFENDFGDFSKGVESLEAELIQFINTRFTLVGITSQAIQLLHQFESSISIESIRKLLREKHMMIFSNYARDLENIKKMYEQYKESPPVPRNTPPVSGSIGWSRQLMRVIEEPMQHFVSIDYIINSKESKATIKTYNKVAKALYAYESLWFEGWCQALEAAKEGLHATLLVKHPSQNRLYVNFDTQIIQLIREARCLQRMGFELPPAAQTVYDQEDRYKAYADNLNFLLTQYYKLLESVQSAYSRLSEPLIRRVNMALEPGLTILTWTSMGIDHFVSSVMSQIRKASDILRMANDILACRMVANVDFIANSLFVDFYKNRALRTCAEFTADQQRHTVEVAEAIQIKNKEIESAVKDLIETFACQYSVSEGTSIISSSQELFVSWEQRTFDAVIQSLRKSASTLRDTVGGALDAFAQALAAAASGSGSFSLFPSANPLDGPALNEGPAVFRAEASLLIPDVVIIPNIDGLQSVLTQATRLMLESTSRILRWHPISVTIANVERQLTPAHTKNVIASQDLLESVTQNRPLIKTVLQLTGALGALKKRTTSLVGAFDEFSFLWKQSRAEEVEKFKNSNPSLEDFETRIRRYAQCEARIEDIRMDLQVGCLFIDFAPIRTALKTESSQWKTAYGSALNARVRSSMEELTTFMEETSSKLQRKITDLDAINQLMTVLGKLRDVESEIEMKLVPIEETYAILSRYNVNVSAEEREQLDAIRYSWKKLIALARKTFDYLRDVGPGFKSTLMKDVKTLITDVADFKVEYATKGPNVQGLKPAVAVERLKAYTRSFEERERKWKAYSMGEELFGLPVTDFPELTSIGKEVKLLAKLYDLYSEVLTTVSSYEEILWENINVDQMTTQLQLFQDRVRKMPKALRDYEAYESLRKNVDDFCETLPLLQMLAAKAIRDRHWKNIGKLCGTELDYTNPEFKVKTLLEANLLKVRDEVEEICSAAVKEAEIESKMVKIRDDWVGREFVLGNFKNRGELILKPADTTELMLVIEDSQMLLGSLLSNRYNAPFRPDIQSWVLKLTTCQEVIELWLQVQALWIYLEAVFSGGDIARQLPQEAKRFANIDKTWCKIMATAAENSNVIKLCFGDETLRNLLPHLLESLEICQKSLSGYLEAKRNLFPRFYFVSDAQLLEILGQGSDPTTIQPHLLSIFANTSRVEFDRVQRNKIISIVSPEGEVIPLSNPVIADGNIEDWLNKLVEEQCRSMKDISREMAARLFDMVDEAEKDKIEKFIDAYQAQIALLGLQVHWTVDSELALAKAKTEKGAMQASNKKFKQILSHLVDFTTKDLTSRDRTKIETLITIHIHQVDIFEVLVKMRIKSPTDFEWLKQTRFYWRNELDKCIISVTDVDFEYSWEFLGCTERLVITPLTDRIYISCAQAMTMYYGGAPAGPAGTGKTETTKDMGRTCGKYFITINCSDQMDYRAMAKLYKGIAQSGIWCGFDEVNRVELEVLSVVAAQIACVFNAMRDRKATFTFVDGSVLRLDPQCGIFITMNPGYAGRTELPENMKALFRSIAVVVPDRQIIMRVRLAASGFQENTMLSKKFFILYRLSEEQLSKQTHYDFGLRNILSVLRSCGSNKRNNPTAAEITVLMRVLRDMNISKLVDEDEPLFMGLIADLFPGIVAEKENHPELQRAIANQVELAGLINYPDWNLKVIQFYEQWRVRHGLCIMGPSGSGKSRCISTLSASLTEAVTPIREVRMNPKAITATQMFGRLDTTTNDWTDGIFSSLWRRGVKVKDKQTWIVLDGPVDAVWIENLNTVLDDTRTLTLANGDRLVMPPTLKLVFEVGNLDNASPATVSRMGMVYMGASALGWKPVLEAWLKKLPRPADEGNGLKELFNKHIDDFNIFLRDNCKSKMDVSEVNQISTMLRMLTGLLLPDDFFSQPLQQQQQIAPGAILGGPSLRDKHIEHIFMFTLMWSVGGLLEISDRKKVHDYFKQAGLDVPAPDRNSADTVYEYFVNKQGEWEHWKSRVPQWSYPKNTTPEFSSILVPTVDNVRCEFLIETMAKQRLPVLLIGESGTAKTVTIQQYIAKEDGDVVKNKFVCFSSATTCLIFQRTIEASVEKRMGNLYGPPPGKRMIVFIDDINMPEINEWGDQITNEIVRQLIEDKGFYNLEKPGDWTAIADLQFLAAMNQPGGGRNDIPSRLKRQFAIFNVTLPSTSSVDLIYGSIVQGHFCDERGFSPEVVNMSKRLTALTRKLWEATKAKMLPTPAKFHYIFNLRDLSRIFQGVLNSSSEVITSPQLLLSLWKHECDRVLPDKFISGEDTEWFTSSMRNLLMEEFSQSLADQILEPKYFVDFLRDAPEPDDPEQVVEVPKVYEPIPSFAGLQERLEFYMGQYNELNRKAQMDLVLFEFAMQHLMRISRIIRTPRGNALLVGVGGSGKQSLTRLASYIAGYKTFQITITKTYNTSNLMEDLKALYKMAATSTPVTFLFTDNEIKEEGFLEYINMILTSGEVAGLFPKDEMDGVLEDLRPVAKKSRPGFIDTSENLYKFFIDRVRDNLHVVLCFSPVGEKFRTRARKFPGLISGCTIDWFRPWPVEALLATAEKFLRDFTIVADEPSKKALIQHMTYVHECVGATTLEYFNKFRKYTYVTPKSYLSFINSYKRVYALKHAEVKEMADRINLGLTKLLGAAEDVSKMKVQLIQKEKDLAEAQKRTEILLVEITAQTAAAEIKKNEVQLVKDALSIKANEINAEKVGAESELEAAKPALAEAENALNQIKPADISTLKKLAKPPNLIKRIMDGVLLLRMLPIDPWRQDPEFTDRKLNVASWECAGRMMSDMGFLAALMSFPKDQINDETVELLEPYIAMEDFTTEIAKKASGNSSGLCTWVKAMVTYQHIAKNVAPKKARLREAESLLRSALKELAAAQAELDAKQRDLDEMQAKFDAAMAEKQRLLEDADRTRRNLESAEALISGLAGERERWTRQSKEFDDTIRRLIGDVAIACAFLSYCGPFNQEFRSLLMAERFTKDLTTRKVPLSKNMNVIKFLTNENVIGEWNLQGLPSDELSVQNGIIVTTSTRYPLLIDPQGQAKKWIKNREEANDLVVTNFNHKAFRNSLEDCLTFGKPLLIEDLAEETDPVLDPLLEKNLIKSGRGWKVRVGDKEVDFSDGFRLYMTTKLPNPHYSPEISAKTSIIDFAVTVKGLEDQLLGRVILQEKADLEESRKSLLEEINTCKKTVSKCEEDLLVRLSSSSGNLLEDTELIEVLARTKKISQEVTEKLTNAEQTEKKITEAREEFRPVATRGSIMYFVITELSLVNVMYQTSLAQFLKLFDEAIERSEKSPIASKRIKNIIEYSTFSIFKYIQRGLYEKHKPMYSLLLTLKIEMQAGRIDGREFGALLKGGAALDINNVRKKPFGWIPNSSWLNVCALTDLPIFKPLLDQIAANEAAWKAWYDTEKPEDEPLPDGYQDKLSKFYRLLVVRSWREDRAMAAGTQYIMEAMGRNFVESIPLDLDETWGESDTKCPIICLLSMGSDPTSAIESLAKKKKIDIKMVSMGQGQEVIARKLVAGGITAGGWVLLQNCHLGLKYLQELEETIVSLQEYDPSLRIWITTEPHIRFPINLLQMSIKLTNEPPQGMKAGLKRSYAWVNQDMLDAVDKPQWRPMLYTLAFLHSTVIERKKFGPLGWSISYEFGFTDLAASAQFLQNHLYQTDAKKPMSWTTVRYMICEVQYGGRITDDYDKRLLNTYGNLWFTPSIFTPEYQFYKGYNVPDLKNVVDYRASIDSLPIIDTPEIFGMHPNAELTFNAAQSGETFNTIISVQPKDSGGSGGETREDAVLRIASDLQSKMPADYTKTTVKTQIKKMGALNPLNIFLAQEVDRMQIVIGLMRKTLSDLKLAIAGTIIMSPDLQDALNALYDARVPAKWIKVSWLSPTLGFWFSDVQGRAQQFTSWLEFGRPKVFWLTGFFNPQGFLTAMKQESTRKHAGWALDSVVTKNEVLKLERDQITAGPDDGVYIYGLFLEGAAWDKKNGKLMESPPKVLFSPLPVIHVTAVSGSSAVDARTYVCPVYRLPRRTALNYIFDITLTTDVAPDRWTLRGLAALASVN